MVEYSLHGKVAVITGASKGLGKAMALALGSAGVNVALVSRDIKQLNGVKEAVENGAARRRFFKPMSRKRSRSAISNATY